MFEDYLEDASYFFECARQHSSDEKIARRYFRASIFCGVSAMEAFVNYVADTLSKGAPLQAHEVAFLRDKRYVFKLSKPELLVEDREFHQLEDKLGLLIKRFLPAFDFKIDADWKKLLEFKELRNGLVHPRQDDDTTPLAVYERDIKLSIKAIISIMNKLYQAMFHAQLRRKLLDLIPD